MLLLRLAPLLLLALPVRAQLSGTQWEAYTSMRQINRVLVHQDAVWAGTGGGVLRYDQQPNPMRASPAATAYRATSS